jgi:hypothetical protein
MNTPIRPLDGDDRHNEPEATRTTPLPARHVDSPDADAEFTTSDESGASRTAVQEHPSPVIPDRATIVARQKERFGGIKVGSAFFGWLTATGMAVLLIALLTAAGVAFGVATNTEITVDQAVQESQNGTGTAQTVGLVGGITLLVVLFVAYYCGGYVAGRMARFNGIKQGLAVWLWGVLMALVIATVAAIAGARYDVFAQLKLPRLPVNEGQVTATGAIVIGAAILAALIGALLGGLAGMRFHRNVDEAGLEPAVT